MIIEELGAKFIWLKDCMQEFDVLNAPEKVSIKETIANSFDKFYSKYINHKKSV